MTSLRHAILNAFFLALAFANPAGAGEDPLVVFDFSEAASLDNWQSRNDGVMGGVSEGAILHDSQGYAVFLGRVSLENNGGFSSVRALVPPFAVTGNKTAVLRLRGDGKTYRFIVKDKADTRHYYEASFETTGDWQDVRIPLSQMVPHWRGDRLDLPNFSASAIEEVRFMIANGRAESFRLEIAEIRLEK